MIIVARKDMKPGMILRSMLTRRAIFVTGQYMHDGRIAILALKTLFPMAPLIHDQWELVGVNAKLRGKYADRLPEND